MFRSIGSDLREFVYSLTEDTSSAVKQVKDETINTFEKLETDTSEKLTEAQEEAIFRMGLIEVYTTPLEVNHGKDPGDTFDDETEELKLDESEDLELQSFLNSFSVREKTDEITELLTEYDTTLKLRFEELVPLYVTYEDFWKRFYFRCSPARIERAWAEEDAKAKAARSEVVQSVKNAIGKPVNAILVSGSRPIKAVVRSMSGNYTEKYNPSELQQTQSALVCAREELENLQHVIADSNNRITALRTKLNETNQRLEESERYAAEIKAEFDKTKAALKAQSDEPGEYQQEANMTGTAISLVEEEIESVRDVHDAYDGNETEKETLEDEEEVIANNELPSTSELEIIQDPIEPESIMVGKVEKDVPMIETLTKCESLHGDITKSPTSIIGRLNMNRSSVFKLASVGIWGSDSHDSDADVSDGWGNEGEAEIESENA